MWDPDNRMNPGKLVDAVRVYDPIENLRDGINGRASPSAGRRQDEGAGKVGREFETHFAFAMDGGSMERATERCVGVGACRKTEGGVMCPSYRATGQEKHSTRGRAHLLWEMLAGSLRTEGFRSEAVHEALDLCLSCKACKTECPVQVDMAAYKAEFLAQRYKGRMHPLQHYVFGFADKLARMGSIAPGFTNAILTGGWTSGLVKRIAGVAKERKLPELAGAIIPEDADRRATGRLLVRRLGRRDGEFCFGRIRGTTTTIRRRWRRRRRCWRRRGLRWSVRESMFAADGRCMILDFWTRRGLILET